MPDDVQTEMRIQYALKERDARIASHIVEAMRHVTDMVEEQSPSVIEALVDYLTDLQKPDSTAPKNRRKLRDALIEYGTEALREARRREHTLYYGLTGETEIVHEDEKSP